MAQFCTWSRSQGDGLVERDGRLVVAASGLELSDADVRSLRDAGQR